MQIFIQYTCIAYLISPLHRGTCELQVTYMWKMQTLAPIWEYNGEHPSPTYLIPEYLYLIPY